MTVLAKPLEDRLAHVIENPKDLHVWKLDVLERLRQANEGTDLRAKVAALSEVCFLFSTQMAYDAVVKTRALTVMVRDRHGLTDEEIEKCLNGNSMTRQICIRPQLPTP